MQTKILSCISKGSNLKAPPKDEILKFQGAASKRKFQNLTLKRAAPMSPRAP
ncbi:hypothetical protein [uncultured Campylobacter sp.]|uniref:hypothetical protein n=1 Tax=uncultured Campylobacter sp. TaxID=218934 RepID=UPI002621B6B0|nr:hypothetical protein [uncultured Campylobacter sp.]